MRFKSSAIFLLFSMFAGVIAKQGLEKSNYYRQLHGVPDFQISDEIADNALLLILGLNLTKSSAVKC